MKTLPALLFALGITAVVAVAMVIIGSNALVNPNTIPITNSPSSSNVAAASFNSSSQASDPAAASQTVQLQQLQALVTQYQDREKQYKSELNQSIQQLNDANSQLQQANAEIQQFQQLLQVMQQRGLIRITSDGQIYLRGDQ